MKKKIKKHSDMNLGGAMSRYTDAELVNDHLSWKELFNMADRFNRGEKIRKDSFNEYKLFNLTIEIEQKIITIIDLFSKEGRFNNSCADRQIINSLMSYRKIDISHARKILYKETRKNSVSLFNPHIMIYVSGMGLGNLIKVFEDCVSDYPKKVSFVKDLYNFKNYRNDFTHNLLSSRINLQDLVIKAIKTGLKILEKLDSMWEINLDDDSVGAPRLKI